MFAWHSHCKNEHTYAIQKSLLQPALAHMTGLVLRMAHVFDYTVVYGFGIAGLLFDDQKWIFYLTVHK